VIFLDRKSSLDLSQSIHVNDIAPTLAALLDVETPTGPLDVF